MAVGGSRGHHRAGSRLKNDQTQPSTVHNLLPHFSELRNSAWPGDGLGTRTVQKRFYYPAGSPILSTYTPFFGPALTGVLSLATSVP